MAHTRVTRVLWMQQRHMIHVRSQPHAHFPFPISSFPRFQLTWPTLGTRHSTRLASAPMPLTSHHHPFAFYGRHSGTDGQAEKLVYSQVETQVEIGIQWRVW